MQFRGGMNELVRQAARMQRKIDQVKAELKEREVTVEGLGGKVKVIVTFGRNVRRIDLDKALLQTEDIDLLEGETSLKICPRVRYVKQEACCRCKFRQKGKGLIRWSRPS